jgi:hypothetical protein
MGEVAQCKKEQCSIIQMEKVSRLESSRRARAAKTLEVEEEEEEQEEEEGRGV